MTLIPVLLAFTLTTLHWYQTEESSKRLRTLPLLLAQIWPQYRVGRILWLYKKGDDKWIKEKELIERKLSSLGEFLFEPNTLGFLAKISFTPLLYHPGRCLGCPEKGTSSMNYNLFVWFAVFLPKWKDIKKPTKIIKIK